MAPVCIFILVIVGCAVAAAAVFGFIALRLLFIRTILASADWWPVVHVASLSLSLSSAPPAPAIIGNWSVALSVENHMRAKTVSLDQAQIVLLHHGVERVAETYLERFSVAPGGIANPDTGAVPLSLLAGDRGFDAMAMDKEDGVMEFGLTFRPSRDGLNRWFECSGLKVGFSRQNQGQSQMGSLLNSSPHKCERVFRAPGFGVTRF